MFALKPITLGAVSAEHRTVPLLMPTFVTRAKAFELNPPYQRSEVWTIPFQQRLILSILHGRPLPAIYTCADIYDSNIDYVVDGKQRVRAILDFVDNKFGVPADDEKNGCLYYRMLITDLRYKRLKETWEEYQIYIVKYGKLSFRDQMQLFQEINTYIPLSTDELTLGEFFYAKQFLQLLHRKDPVTALFKHLASAQMIENKRMRGSIHLARMLHIIYGAELADVWAARHLGLSNSKRFAQKVNVNTNLYHSIGKLDKIIESSRHQPPKSDRLDWSDIEVMPFYDKIKGFLSLLRHLANVLSFNNTVSKKLDRTEMLDIVIFFAKQISDNKLSCSMLATDKQKYLHIIIEYLTARKKDVNMKMNTATATNITNRYKLFEMIFSGSHQGCVGSMPSRFQKSIAALTAGPVCPVDGSALSDTNHAIDHIQPKSRGTTDNYALIGSESNRRKSDLTTNDIDRLRDYIEQ